MTGRTWNPFLRRLRSLAAADNGEAASDRALLERFVGAGDETAFATLVERHAGMVQAACRRVLGPGPDADDAAQATFFVLARKAAQAPWQTSIGPWLHAVAWRIASKARKQRARRALRETSQPVEAASTADDDLSARELRALLDQEVGRLPAKYRAAVVLCYLEGQTNEGAARVLDCPVGTLKARLAAARELLRGRLERRGVAVSSAALTACLTEAGRGDAQSVCVESTSRAARAFLRGEGAGPAYLLARGELTAMRNNQLLALVGMLAMAVVLVGAGLGLHAVLAVPVTEDKPVQPAPEQPKAVEFTGKLNIWRTIGPDGRALTTINATGGQPDQDTIVLSFGKKGEQAADKLAEEAAALYRKSPKIDVIVTGVPDVRPNESGGLTKIVRVRTIKAKP